LRKDHLLQQAFQYSAIKVKYFKVIIYLLCHDSRLLIEDSSENLELFLSEN